ncbi:uncharacterized protein EI90DRAFT_3167791 [Cantharellus anzutake]|uniref:uncharacterized protein n=1 Tax=Cantharellus anzutake TaxID=1750568 RepID=UPI001906935E|nr:uncharacterized protein EI90DRAFT_3167791 [Cantharellus anzutake]KAF8317832.1 hypothetical protein EI90DRAFT_3167791 [Cantharellus anzutake]
MTKSSWPPSYRTEMFQCSHSGGGLSFGSVLVASDDAALFGDEIDACRHAAKAPSEPAEEFEVWSEVELRKMAGGLDLDEMMVTNDRFNACYVDVGLEVSTTDNSVFWHMDAHHLILQEMFPTWNEAILHAHTRPLHKNYKRDLVAQLTEISGFRYEVPVRQNQNGAQYLNVYHTDKALTYRLSRKGVTNSAEADAVILTGQDSWFQGMYNTYFKAYEERYTGAA